MSEDYEVACPARGLTSLSVCERCEHLDVLVLDPDDRETHVRCRPVVARRRVPHSFRELLGLKPRARDTPAGEIMTHDVICVTQDVPIADLEALFVAAGISAVPVVDYEHQPMGIVTKTDLVRARAHQGRICPATARDLMGPALQTIRVNESIELAAARFVQAGIHHVPVVDRDGLLVGMLSSLDLARFVARR
jgi:CBS domain-containing protein